jgi:hypothetical protein
MMQADSPVGCAATARVSLDRHSSGYYDVW